MIIQYIVVVLLAINGCFGFELRVTGGFEAKPNQFPYLVSIRSKKSLLTEEKHICGGAIMSSEYILTAASCVLSRGRLTVIAGKHNLEIYETGQQSREVSMTIIHKDYKRSTLWRRIPENNIALLKLKYPLILKNATERVSMPNVRMMHSGFAFVSGWGEKKQVSAILHAAKVPLLPWDSCEEVLKTSYKKVKLSKTQICTGPIGEKISACPADVGGPLVQYDEKGVPNLVGIVSWTSKSCDTALLPTVYTYVVPYYVDWINDKLEAS